MENVEQKMPQPKPGDKVMLPSGGPGMTVLDVGAHTGYAWCRWIDGNGTIHEASFPPGTLVIDPRSHLQEAW